jgi:hypothetical protein
MSGYIGTQPVPQATQTRDSFTATSGQTSFATGGYTPNFLDVYLNGVKLSAADYTASNGSDVVLASGAATGDILEVVAFTTFNSASSSIDDNGNATALTIDSSENVLANTTSTSVIGNGGFAIKPQTGNGTRVDISNDGEAMLLDGAASGPIIGLYGNGTSVGSIGTNANGNFQLYGSVVSHVGLQFGSPSILPINNSGASADNAVDLGDSNVRFKDLYLSGGVDFGGAVNSGGVVSSSNKLDDYEEGTFTPVLAPTSGGSFALDSGGNTLAYTKIGRQVTITGRIIVSSVSSPSGDVKITGLPFVAANMGDHSGDYTGLVNYIDSSTGIQTFIVTRGFDDQSWLNLKKGASAIAASDSFYMSFSYFTT